MAARPDAGIHQALKGREFAGRLVVVAAGKAAYAMANTAHEVLGNRIDCGFIVSSGMYASDTQMTPITVRIGDAPLQQDITKAERPITPVPGFEFLEADHPLPGKQSLRATRKVLDATSALSEADTVLFLLSGGASAMFEDPIVPLRELRHITDSLIQGGVDIGRINAVRKRLSRVKGGRFARWCEPAQILTLVLSDVSDGCVDTVASGPTCPDTSTCDEACSAIESCGCKLDKVTWRLLHEETPHDLENAETILVGDASSLVAGAEAACINLGYMPVLLNGPITGEATGVGNILAGLLQDTRQNWESDIHEELRASLYTPDHTYMAWIGVGETTVHVRGTGLGGRNLEVALSAAKKLGSLEKPAGQNDACVLSVGSDGRDGPTNVAGGYADEKTAQALCIGGVDADASLANNDSYHALAVSDGLITTGATGTNVGDLMLVLRIMP